MIGSQSAQQVQNRVGIIEPGNISNLYNRPVLDNKDGTVSTTRSMSFQDEQGREVLIPTVINGKSYTDKQAINYYYKTGEHLGKFTDPKTPDSYAEMIHNAQMSYLLNKKVNK